MVPVALALEYFFVHKLHTFCTSRVRRPSDLAKKISLSAALKSSLLLSALQLLLHASLVECPFPTPLGRLTVVEAACHQLQSAFCTVDQLAG